MSDRLNSLINTFFACVDIDKFYLQNQKEKLADWLRENGVIVPPCKVGDTVYFTEDVGIQTSLEIVEYIVENITIGVKPSKCILYCKSKKRGFKDRFFNSSFGETVFFTRKEAEEAIKSLEVTQ